MREGGGAWDTDPSSFEWVLGTAAGLDASLLNAVNGSVNLPVNSGTTLYLFAADNGGLFAPGNRFTITVTFSDSQRTSAQVTVAAFAEFVFVGTARDRVGQGTTAVAPDGRADGVFTLSFPVGTGTRTIRHIALAREGGGNWDTDPATFAWILGVANGIDTALLNSAGSDVNVPINDGAILYLFGSDNGGLFNAGNRFNLSLVFADGGALNVSVTVPNANLALGY
jgi:hypothetical protein